MDEKLREEIANFRFSLISPIVCREKLYNGETAENIREAAGKIYRIPGSRKSRVSTRTIERYLKKYREGGYDSLKPNYGKSQKKVNSEYLDSAVSLKQENRSRSVSQIIETLEMSGEVPKGVLKHSTVYDYFNREGLNRQLGKKESKAYQRFSPKHRNQRWQGDTCHLLYTQNPNNKKKKSKLYLIGWLDEASRIITHGQFYMEEKSYTLEDSLKKAIIKFGKPEQIYVDNGAVYSSHQLTKICGTLGIHLSHTRPYKPQGRGKIERFFSTVRSSFLPEIEVILRERDLTVDEINDYFFLWLRQHYHEKMHSAIKKKPMLNFESDVYPIQRVDLETLADAFLIEETRKVDKTGVFRLNRIDYQASLELARKKITLRYDPFDLAVIQVHFDGKRYEDAYPLTVPEKIDYSVKEEVENTAEPTGINYLELLRKKEEEEGREVLSYSTFKEEE